MADIYSPLPYEFYTRKPLEVKFSGLDLSSDAGFLLVRQAEQRQQICQGIVDCLEDRRDPSKIKHTRASYQITLNMLYINLGFSGSPRQSSVAILKGNDIS